MIKAVIFDFDYTLEKFTLAEQTAEQKIGNLIEKEFDINKNKFLKEFYINKKRFLKKEKKPVYYSRGLWMRRALSMLNIKVGDSRINQLENIFWREIAEKVSLYKHTKQVLSSLKRRFKLAILTDSDGKRRFKLMRIKKLGLQKYFNTIITTDQIGMNKPNKKCFLTTARKLNVKPEECIMIGDHPETDLIGAKRAGMKTIWLRKGPYSKEKRNCSYPYIDYKARNIVEVYERIIKISKVSR